MINYTTILSLLTLLFPFVLNAQNVSNVRFEQQGKQIYIYYDLQGNNTCNVKVYCSVDGGKIWGGKLKSVTGAIGENQKPGTNKLIIWDVLKEREKLNGDISFKIDAINTSSGYFIDRRDGRKYKWVRIGTQIWMAENLNYRTNNSWCYDNDKANCNTYGRLYTWNAAKTACPSGWHLPSDGEWSTITTYLGGESIAGGKMKETGTTHWKSPNTGATNSSGFTALPGGYRLSNGSFYDLGSRGRWWSSTERSGTFARGRYMGCNNDQVGRGSYYKAYGFSVRCVKN